MMKLALFLVFFAVLSLVIFLGWASKSNLSAGFHEGKIVEFIKGDPKVVTNVKIMSWNIAYAFGQGSEGTNYHQMSKEETLKKLNKLVEVIQEHNPDVVFLQEIDFDSKRTNHIDQVKYIATRLGYPYGAYATCWDNNYIPFPYFPVRNHFGAMDSGGAVISRFPIKRNEVEVYEKPKENPWWYNLFYLHRFSQFVQLEINGKDYWVANSHLEAFKIQNRVDQANILMKMISDKENVLLYTGDFNTTPTGATKLEKFLEYPEDTYVGDDTYKVLSENTTFKEAVNLDDYIANESKYFTFPAITPDRRLDYFFVNQKFQTMNFRIDDSQASDHKPIILDIKLEGE